MNPVWFWILIDRHMRIQVERERVEDWKRLVRIFRFKDDEDEDAEKI